MKRNRPMGIGAGVPKPKRRKMAIVASKGPVAVSMSKVRLTDEQRGVIEGFLGMCDVTAKAFVRRCRVISYEDFYQEAYVGLSVAFKTYRDSEGTILKTHLYTRMNCACADLMRRNTLIRIPDHMSSRRSELPRCVSMEWGGVRRGDRIFYEPGSREVLPGDRIEGDDLYEAWMRGFDAETRHIVRRYVVDGESMTVIGAELGLSGASISRKFASAMERLRERSCDPRYAELMSA